MDSVHIKLSLLFSNINLYWNIGSDYSLILKMSRSTNMSVAPMIPLFIIQLIKTDSGQ